MENTNISSLSLPVVKTKTDTSLLKDLVDFHTFVVKELDGKDWSKEAFDKLSQEYLAKRFSSRKGKLTKERSKKPTNGNNASGETKEKKDPSEYNKFIGENIRSLRADTPGMTFKAAMEIAVSKWHLYKKEKAAAQEKTTVEENSKNTEKAGDNNDDNN